MEVAADGQIGAVQFDHERFSPTYRLILGIPGASNALRIARKLGVAPKEAAYLGDSPEDVTMAKAAGVFAVGIPGGFPNRDALAASEPDLLAESLDAAIDHVLSPTA